MTNRLTGYAARYKTRSYRQWRLLSHLILILLLPITSGVQASISNPLLGLPASQIAAAYGEQQEYKITRNGKEIGTHVLSFRTEGDTLFVNIDSSITVTILRIPVYRLSYKSEETWRDNAMASVVATTTEDGKATTVRLGQSVGGIDAQDTHYASNHWHPGVLTGDVVFNTLTGESSKITVTDLGVESVAVSDTTVQATHYQYDDDIHANVWYDSAGLWLKMKFVADDGSVIQYLRKE